MARPLRIEYQDAYYHVMGRGNERKPVFRTPKDYTLFLDVLSKVCDRLNIKIASYCLMSNHIHLLVHTPDANLSQAMKRLFGVYTIRFNRRHRRVGHLFQGRYKALIVDKDSYLLEVSRYIHLNPCKAGIIDSPEAYRWSSMRDFLSRKSHDWLDKESILRSFRSPKAYLSFVLQGMVQSEDLLSCVQRGLFLGTEAFIERFQGQLHKKQSSPIAHQRKMIMLPIERLRKVVSCEAEDVQMYLLWNYAHRTQREIGALFGKTDSAVSHATKRLDRLLQDNGVLRHRLAKLVQAIQLSRTDP